MEVIIRILHECGVLIENLSPKGHINAFPGSAE